MVRRKTSDVAVFRKIFVDREYEFPVGWHPNTIVDAGANCGYSTVYFASRFPKSRILAIEPDEANLAVLRHNTSGYPNVTILSAALWPTSERLAIVDKSAEKWAIQVQPANEQAERTIAAITMEDVLAWAGRDRLGIVKIDIEGAEKRLFEGPGAWLGRVDCIAVELHDWFVGGCTAALENAISPYCFARSTRGENTILVATTSDPAGNAFAGGHMTDEGPRATSGK